MAAGCWLAAGVFYLASEAAAAFAFTPSYSYAHNYISDLGVPVCGFVYDNRTICSPLHALINADFVAQGLLFFSATLALCRSIATPAKYVFIAFAALNALGNILIGIYPESDPAQIAGALTCHVAGAFLAIVFGNAAILTTAWVFRGLGLVGFHRTASVALPLLAAVAFIMLILARGSDASGLVPHGVWERISVYTITSWELLTAACLMGRARSR